MHDITNYVEIDHFTLTTPQPQEKRDKKPTNVSVSQCHNFGLTHKNSNIGNITVQNYSRSTAINGPPSIKQMASFVVSSTCMGNKTKQWHSIFVKESQK